MSTQHPKSTDDTTTSYGLASSSASLVTSHSISLTALATATTYHYEVVSTNGSG